MSQSCHDLRRSEARKATLAGLSLATSAVMMVSFSTAIASPPPTDAQAPAAEWKLIDAGGALPQFRSLEQRANTYVDNRQLGAAIDADHEGNLLITWGSRRQEHGTFGVFAQQFDALGRMVGPELHINEYVLGHQMEPAVAFLSSGDAWITWESTGQDGSASSVFARRLMRNSDGLLIPTGSEIAINQHAQGRQFDPAIAASTDGRVLVTWAFDDNGQRAGRARLFNANGEPLTDEFAIVASDEDPGQLLATAPHALPDGGFAIAWARLNPDHRPAGIRLRLYDHSGQPRGDAIVVDDLTDRMHIEPSLTVDTDGRILVSWMRSRISGGYDACVRRYDANSALLGDTLVAADEADGWKSGATIAAAPDGRFVVTYNVFGEKDPLLAKQRPVAPSHIRARVFDVDGQPMGKAFQLNQFDEGQQRVDIGANIRRAVWSDRDQIAVIWLGNTGSDRRGVGLTLLAPESLFVPAPTDAQLAAVGTTATIPLDDFLDVNDLHSAHSRMAQAPPDWDPNWTPEPPDGQVDGVGPDFGFSGIQSTGWVPADPDIAAGPDHVVLVVNQDLAFYTKTGQQTFQDGLVDFFRPLGAESFVFDPVALWDTHSRRFVVVAAEHASTGNHLCLAVSDDEDPNGTWHKYRVNTDHLGDFIDFENLGIDKDAIYVAADYFGTPSGNQIHIFEKAPMLVGAPVTLKSVRTSNFPRSLGAVKTHDTDAPAQYFATTYSGSYSRIGLEAIRDATGTPRRDSYNLSVPGFSNPPDADQLGTSNRADTIDFRIKNGVYRNGKLWLAHNTGENSTARTRWYEIDMNGWPESGRNPTLVQSGTIDLGYKVHNWFADIHVDADNNAVLTYNRSSPDEYISVQRSTRRFYDQAGRFRTPSTLQESTTPETGSRWGDYSGIDEDADDPGVFWSYTMYRTSSWRTWVGRVDTNQTMLLSGGPLFAGQNIDLVVEGAAQGGRVHLTYSLTGEGLTNVPSLNASLNLANPKLAGSATSDNEGRADFSFIRVPPGAPTRVIWFQAIEDGNTSNVLTTQINR